MGPLIVLIVLIVMVVIAGTLALRRRSRRARVASAEAGTGPNEFLQSPPTSFPSTAASLEAPPPGDADAEIDADADADAEVDAEVEVEVEVEVERTPEGGVEPAPVVTVDAGADDEQDDPDEQDDQDDRHDETIAARFKAPGTRSVTSTPTPEPPTPEPPTSESPTSESPTSGLVPVAAHALEDPSLDGVEPTTSPESPESTDSAESTETVETVEPIEAVEPDAVVAIGGPVIDLSGEQAVVTPADAWEDVVLQPEPDAVDHVLQALINRARFQQVEVEAVATELVERADLQGQEVSEVLAELVGRADESTLESTLGAAPTSELTLFNDEVPSRPGQLTDFARLAPADKKRIIVRVLCLLVARSEDQALPPRADVPASEPRSWPLARAVWPLATGAPDGEAQLPSRRLAKSG
jgi:hypothetical protein